MEKQDEIITSPIVSNKILTAAKRPWRTQGKNIVNKTFSRKICDLITQNQIEELKKYLSEIFKQNEANLKVNSTLGYFLGINAINSFNYLDFSSSLIYACVHEKKFDVVEQLLQILPHFRVLPSTEGFDGRGLILEYLGHIKAPIEIVKPYYGYLESNHSLNKILNTPDYADRILLASSTAHFEYLHQVLELIEKHYDLAKLKLGTLIHIIYSLGRLKDSEENFDKGISYIIEKLFDKKNENFLNFFYTNHDKIIHYNIGDGKFLINYLSKGLRSCKPEQVNQYTNCLFLLNSAEDLSFAMSTHNFQVTPELVAAYLKNPPIHIITSLPLLAMVFNSKNLDLAKITKIFSQGNFHTRIADSLTYGHPDPTEIQHFETILVKLIEGGIFEKLSSGERLCWIFKFINTEIINPIPVFNALWDSSNRFRLNLVLFFYFTASSSKRNFFKEKFLEYIKTEKKLSSTNIISEACHTFLQVHTLWQTISATAKDLNDTFLKLKKDITLSPNDLVKISEHNVESYPVLFDESVLNTLHEIFNLKNLRITRESKESNLLEYVVRYYATNTPLKNKMFGILSLLTKYELDKTEAIAYTKYLKGAHQDTKEQLLKILTGESSAPNISTTPSQPTQTHLLRSEPNQEEERKLSETSQSELLKVVNRWLQSGMDSLGEKDLQKLSATSILFFYLTDLNEAIKSFFTIELNEKDIQFLDKQVQIIMRNPLGRGVYLYPHRNGDIINSSTQQRFRKKNQVILNFRQVISFLKRGILYHYTQVAEEDSVGSLVQSVKPDISIEINPVLQNVEDLFYLQRLVEIFKHFKSVNARPAELALEKAVHKFAYDITASIQKCLFDLMIEPPIHSELEIETLEKVSASLGLSLTYANGSYTLSSTSDASKGKLKLLYLLHIFNSYISSKSQIVRIPPKEESIAVINNFSHQQKSFKDFWLSLAYMVGTVEGFLKEYGQKILESKEDVIFMIEKDRLTFANNEVALIQNLLSKIADFDQQTAFDLIEIEEQPERKEVNSHSAIVKAYEQKYFFPVRVIGGRDNSSINALIAKIDDDFKGMEQGLIKPATLLVKGIPIKLILNICSGWIFRPFPSDLVKLPRYIFAMFAANAFSDKLKSVNADGSLSTDTLIENLQSFGQQRGFKSPVQMLFKLEHKLLKATGGFPASLNVFFENFLTWCHIREVFHITNQELQKYCIMNRIPLTNRVRTEFGLMMEEMTEITLNSFREKLLQRKSFMAKNLESKPVYPSIDRKHPVLNHNEVMMRNLKLIYEEMNEEADPSLSDPLSKQLYEKCGDLAGILVAENQLGLLTAKLLWRKAEKLGRTQENFYFASYNQDKGEIKDIPFEFMMALFELMEIEQRPKTRPQVQPNIGSRPTPIAKSPQIGPPPSFFQSSRPLQHAPILKPTIPPVISSPPQPSAGQGSPPKVLKRTTPPEKLAGPNQKRMRVEEAPANPSPITGTVVVVSRNLKRKEPPQKLKEPESKRAKPSEAPPRSPESEDQQGKANTLK